MVYLISCKTTNTCKIGFANRPMTRVSELQTGNPYELTLEYVMNGDVTLERELHAKFDKYRLKGEWFTANPEIIDYFEANCITDKKILNNLKKNPKIPVVEVNENYTYLSITFHFVVESYDQKLSYNEHITVSFKEFPSRTEVREKVLAAIVDKKPKDFISLFYKEIKSSLVVTGIFEIPYDKVAKWIS